MTNLEKLAWDALNHWWWVKKRSGVTACPPSKPGDHMVFSPENEKEVRELDPNRYEAFEAYRAGFEDGYKAMKFDSLIEISRNYCFDENPDAQNRYRFIYGNIEKMGSD